MALSQSALSELLEAFRTGDGVDMIRESVRTVLQELVEIEAAGVHVYHLQHEMRIDRPASVQMIDGEVRFAPNDAYLMMRTGGL